MRICILETGGTINGILDPDAPPPANSRVLAWLQEHASRLQLECDSRLIVMKDSRAIDAMIGRDLRRRSSHSRRSIS